MDWFKHPKYVRASGSLADRFKAKQFRKFRRLRHLVFLCGAATDAGARHILRSYISKNRGDCLVFYADDVWFHLSANTHLNALSVEESLASLADVVVLVVESPGTIAELGAFSLSSPLRQKLLPILDSEYKGSRSFINAGPVRWIEQDSAFKPVIWISLSAIGKCADELEERLDRIKSPDIDEPVDVLNSPKHLLFMLCDLVAITGPTSVEAVSNLTREIVGGEPKLSFETLLSLARTMKLVRAVQIGDVVYYYPPPAGVLDRAFLREKYLNISAYRADFLGAMTAVPEFRDALERSVRS